jgi:hypothetical protein
MSVEVLDRDIGGPFFYFACPDCGWCSQLCDDHEEAARIGWLHAEVKQATRDERR